MAKSIFDPTNSDETLRTGLDGQLGPTAGSFSKMPESLTDGKTDPNSDPTSTESDTSPTLGELEKEIKAREQETDEP